MTSNPYLILLADEDLNDQEIFKNALKSAKYKSKVNILNNGVELINYLNSKIIYPMLFF
jgi:hypothetical protein